MQFRHITGLFLALLIAPFVYGQAIYSYPSPVDPAEVGLSPYLYTGLIGTDDGYMGSGSVAVHPKLVLGCAHLNYGDNDAWLPASYIRWFWKWNQGDYPDDAVGMVLTGYYYFTSYQSNVRKNGMDSPKTFKVDFVANYSATQDTAGGTAASWVDDGKKALTFGNPMVRITGYPAGRYEEGDLLEYRMHKMDFTGKMYVDKDNYLGMDEVETGAGNSGGPVWVRVNGDWAFAGVLVSGLEWMYSGWSSIGVCSLNKGGWGLISSALGQTGSAAALFTGISTLSGVPVAIPDAGSVGRSFSVSGLAGVIQEVKVSLSVTHPRSGDLIVSLRSPSGKTVTLTKAVSPSKSSPADLVLAAQEVYGFTGLFANGTWTLGIKDAYSGNTGTLGSASLEITTR